MLHTARPFNAWPAKLVRQETYQCQRFESVNYACAVGRCCMEFLRLYLVDKAVERPLGSLIEARRFVGICLAQRCGQLYLLAGDKQIHVKSVECAKTIRLARNWFVSQRNIWRSLRSLMSDNRELVKIWNASCNHDTVILSCGTQGRKG